MTIDDKKKKMFEIMDEMIAKGVGINLSAQIALAIVQEDVALTEGDTHE